MMAIGGGYPRIVERPLEDLRVMIAEHRSLRRTRRIMKTLPKDPRCKVCAAPFAGFGSKVVGPLGFKPSRKNPRLCARCIESGPMRGVEADAGMLFADVRGFTALAEQMSPGDVAGLMNRFYEAATATLVRHDAIIDKFSGDQVMAIFVDFILDEDPRPAMVGAAEGILRAVGFGTPEGPWLQVGVGLDYGPAYVGDVAGGDIRDFTAIGDSVNTAARLQAEAAAGQILMSESVYEAVAGAYPDAARVELDLKGKSAPVAARVVPAVSASA
jgi:adenylate cyclase